MSRNGPQKNPIRWRHARLTIWPEDTGAPQGCARVPPREHRLAPAAATSTGSLSSGASSCARWQFRSPTLPLSLQKITIFIWHWKLIYFRIWSCNFFFFTLNDNDFIFYATFNTAVRSVHEFCFFYVFDARWYKFQLRAPGMATTSVLECNYMFTCHLVVNF